MSTRLYDYRLTISSPLNYREGNIIVGVTSSAVGEIVGIEGSDLIVKLANNYQEFVEGEFIPSFSAQLTTVNTIADYSDSITGIDNVFAIPVSEAFSDSVVVYVDGKVASRDTYTIHSNNTIQFLPVEELSTVDSTVRIEKIFPTTDVTSLLVQVVTGDILSSSFVSDNLVNYIETANDSIISITGSPYIAEKNTNEQTAIVRLYTIYYPGEWYPKNSRGNPSNSGDGFPWPYGFPLRFAEILGDTYIDNNYSISYGGVDYKSFGVESGAISSDSTGRISEISLTLGNFDGSIARLIDNSNILGYNSTNSAAAYVNGELVTNIDPRTVLGNVHYNSSLAELKGANAAWDYSNTISHGDTWVSLKLDSRDLLEAVVEIKTTYAKFLDYWPEYSTVSASFSNTVVVRSSLPYRVGDSVTSNVTTNIDTIASIQGGEIVLASNNLDDLPVNSKLYIVNPDADSRAYIENAFVLSRLNSLDETKAEFSLTNWLQYFKTQIPKRKFYQTTCPFAYKGPFCKYPGSGTGTIVSSNPPVQANGYFTVDNVSTEDVSQDICGKTYAACAIRNNAINFGGFPNAS